MNLTCPSCDSTFRIDPGQIGPSGRQVRCGSCGHEWSQPHPGEDEGESQGETPTEGDGPPPAPEAEPPGDAMPAAPPRAAHRRGAEIHEKTQPPGSRRRLVAGWLFFLAVAGSLAAGAYYGKDRIIAAVPAAAELYALIGKPAGPHAGDGFELRDVKSVRRLIDGKRVVVIEGTVANISETQRDVPRLRASVTDETGTKVDEWDFSANIENLPPGGVTRFRTTTRNAPREGNLGIDFVADTPER